MRKWRVGSISMGLSLVLLGISLTISQVKGFEAFEPLMLWWPLILVVLGIEIVLYLFLAKKENPIVKYDFLSIFFVGIIGTVGIVLSILTSTGILTEVQTMVRQSEQTLNLPMIEEKLTDDIKRVIVETGNQQVKIEGTSENELHLFGTYRATVDDKKGSPILVGEDYSMTKVVGNTLYLYFKEPAQRSGPFSTYINLSPTVVVPDHIRLEVRGDFNEIELRPGSLANHWTVESDGNVSVHLNKDSDLLLSAVSQSNLQNSTVAWDKVEETMEATEGEINSRSVYKGTMKLGKGTFHLDIFKSDDVSVNVVEEL